MTLLAAKTNTSPISFWRKNTEERRRSTNETFQASRLDHVLTTYNAENITTRYTRFYPSDHALSETLIKIKAREGQTPWRLSRASIDDESIQGKIIKMSKKLTKNLRKVESKIHMSKLSDDDQNQIIYRIAMSKWNSLVNFTKIITSKWARTESVKRNTEIRELSKCMNNLDIDNEAFNELTEEFKGFEIEKYKIKTELYKFKNKFDNKNLLKFKAQLNTANRTMKKLVIENSVYDNDKDIRGAISDHFTSIFSCHCEEKDVRCNRCIRGGIKYVKNINPQKKSNKCLSNSQRSKFEREVDEDEIEKYVKSKLKKEGKAPGPDGIPYAFIYKFWPGIKKLVTKIIMLTLNKNISSKNFAEGLVIFLPKPGKDSEKINGWRPLTMLNSIYKISSGIMASRIEKDIEQLVHKHQYGFVKKRQAADVIEMLNILLRENNDKQLAVVIDSNNKLGGVKINDELIKGFAFADDNYTALTDSDEFSLHQQIKELMNLMKKFKTISGLDINQES